VKEIDAMPTIDSLETMFIEELKDLYDAERRLTKAIPKLSKAATSDELRQALDNHLAETQEHVSRLEQAFESMDTPAKGKACAGIKGIIEEADEHVGEDFESDDLRDATIIGAAQRAEHYEIAAYGTAIAHARLLGRDDVVQLLEDTLDEEKAADQKLTQIAETVVNLEAADNESEGEDSVNEEDDEREPAVAGGPRRSASPPSARGGHR
jgi:ferritin-like metal-binding protein YciE